jgi:hypothetical protein
VRACGIARQGPGPLVSVLSLTCALSGDAHRSLGGDREGGVTPDRVMKLVKKQQNEIANLEARLGEQQAHHLDLSTQVCRLE